MRIKDAACKLQTNEHLKDHDMHDSSITAYDQLLPRMESSASDDIQPRAWSTYAISPHGQHHVPHLADIHIHERDIKQASPQGLILNEALIPLARMGPSTNNDESCASTAVEPIHMHPPLPAPFYADGHIHEGDVKQASPPERGLVVKDISFVKDERRLLRESFSPLPRMGTPAKDDHLCAPPSESMGMHGRCCVPHSIDQCLHEKDIKEAPLHVEEIPFVNKRPMLNVEALCIQTSDDACNQHEDVVVDICKLIAESQYSSSNQELEKASDPYTPRSALVRRKSLSVPSGCQAELVKKVSFGSRTSPPGKASTVITAPEEQPQPPLYHPQPTKQHSKKNSFSQTTPASAKEISDSNDQAHCEDAPEQENYSLFRTRSGKLERQLSRRHSRPQQEQQKEQAGGGKRRKNGAMGECSMSAGRYFDALKGPELEILRDSEELLLPQDKLWPFLLRFPIGCFGICLGLSSQAILWKVLATSPSMAFLHVPFAINFVLWCFALVALILIFTTYTVKCVLYFEAVRREFHHPVRVNFFFAPWVACMFLALSIPPSITTSIHPSLWCVFVIPILILELKIYGQWLSGGKRRLSKVANPSTHLSLVGNFVSALLAAQIGWKEPAIFFWAVGCIHYLVLFVTLYQRLPTAEALPKELHPVFSFFIAAPSTASVAWKYIVGDFDYVSRIAYFIALFLYASLVVRAKFFCGFRFSVAWWAYTFPMTGSAIATIHYSMQVTHPITQVLAVTLSVIATLTVLMVFISTILHLMWGSLFPNDIAIAITTRRHGRKHNKELRAGLSSINSSNKASDDSKA